MIGIVLAILSAFSWAIAIIFIRKNLHESNIISATAVSTVISALIIWPLALLFTNFNTISFESILFFALAGFIAPGITNLIYNKGMDVVGVTVSASIFATYPMYSSIFAIILLNERVILENFIGIILIIFGVIIIERGMDKSKISSVTRSLRGIPQGYGIRKKRYILGGEGEIS